MLWWCGVSTLVQNAADARKRKHDEGDARTVGMASAKNVLQWQKPNCQQLGIVLIVAEAISFRSLASLLAEIQQILIDWLISFFSGVGWEARSNGIHSASFSSIKKRENKAFRLQFTLKFLTAPKNVLWRPQAWCIPQHFNFLAVVLFINFFLMNTAFLN